MQQWTYALLLAGSILIPLIRSFESRIYFRKYWPALFTGILVMMMVFIPWDVVFTRNGVWGFSHDHVLGLYILSLPLEEWLFFVIIPYCVVFSYEVIRYFFPKIHFPKTALWLSVLLGVGLIVLGLIHADRLYTLVVMLLTGGLLLLQPMLKTHKTWLSQYYVSYLVTLIPFFIVNGVLTALPVVWYDNTQNLGIRMGTIPVEDSAYFMAMMLMVMTVYERIKTPVTRRTV
jgi:lycopene cyclase domain-containing protein